MSIITLIMGIYLGLIAAGFMWLFGGNPAIFISNVGYVGLITLYLISGVDIILTSNSITLSRFITNKYIAISSILFWPFVLIFAVINDLLIKLASKYYG